MNKETSKKKFPSTLTILKTMRENNSNYPDGKQKFPKKGTRFSAGHDLYVKSVDKVSDNFVIVSLGLRFQPPKNYKVIFVPRSSFTKTNWVMQNSPSQGDPDYTGEYQLRFRAIPIGYNLKTAIKNLFRKEQQPTLIYEPFPYKIGERCGQMFLERIIRFKFEEVDEFKETQRGSGGFGSTGV